MEGGSLKRKICRMVVCGLLFFAVTVPFRYLMPLVTVTEVRPASALPPVFGMMFGVWGALGCALGNLAADFCSGYPVGVCLAGFVAQFLYGYMPYKFWYVSPWGKESAKTPHLSNTSSVVKYLIMILLDSLMMASLVAVILEEFKISDFLSVTTALLLLNNFDFGILLGIPIVIGMGVCGVEAEKPRQSTLPGGRFYDAFFWGGVAMLIIHGCLAYAGLAVFPPEVTGFAGVLCMVVYARKPVRKEVHQEVRGRAKMSLNEKVILVFLAVGIVTTLLVGTAVWVETRQHDHEIPNLWNRIFCYVAVSLNLFFLIAVLFLRYMERLVTVPVEQISDAARAYAGSCDAVPDTAFVTAVCEAFKSNTTEVGYLASSLSKMVGDLELYMSNLEKVTAEKERIGAELSVAARIQSSMLPDSRAFCSDLMPYMLFASMTPAKEVGGDFYDFFQTDESHLGIVMADVSGKGVPAALFMVIAKSLLKVSAQEGLSPGRVLEKVNRQLCETNAEGMFVTVWLGIMETATGRLVCANAGHEYPVIRKADHEYELLKDRHGFVLAGLEESRYREYEIKLDDGDCLFLYTDGVTEAVNKDNELYGTDRLLASLNNCRAQELNTVLAEVKSDIDRFAGLMDQFDDITMLMLEMKQGRLYERD